MIKTQVSTPPNLLPNEVDHIDPVQGYLVSGLSVPLNLTDSQRSINSRKSNRFLPWRWSIDEIGGIPVEEGDFCQFLDLETGEWVLESFLGSWWFEQTRSLCGASKSGKDRLRTRTAIFDKTDPRNIEGNYRGGKKGGLKGGQTTLKRGVGIFDQTNPNNTEGKSKGGKKGIRTLFVSMIDGYISNSQNVSRVMRLRGHNPSSRVRLDSIPLSSLIWT